MSSLSQLPWKKLMKWYWTLRAFVFTSKPPGGAYIVVEGMPVIEMERILGREYFTHDWEFSYNYRGEDLNMRRCFYKHDEYKWYQLHVRGFEFDGMLALHAHTELEPSDYPKEHLNGVNINASEGFRDLRTILDDNGVDYETKSAEEIGL